jgi:hypothetical protein
VRYSRKDIWIACLIAVLVAVSVGATFHDISGDHDQSICQICVWLQLGGGLAVGPTLLLVFLALQVTVLRRSSERLCRSHRFFRLRAPPLR